MKKYLMVLIAALFAMVCGAGGAMAYEAFVSSGHDCQIDEGAWYGNIASVEDAFNVRYEITRDYEIDSVFRTMSTQDLMSTTSLLLASADKTTVYDIVGRYCYDNGIPLGYPNVQYQCEQPEVSATPILSDTIPRIDTSALDKEIEKEIAQALKDTTV